MVAPPVCPKMGKAEQGNDEAAEQNAQEGDDAEAHAAGHTDGQGQEDEDHVHGVAHGGTETDDAHGTHEAESPGDVVADDQDNQGRYKRKQYQGIDKGY